MMNHKAHARGTAIIEALLVLPLLLLVLWGTVEFGRFMDVQQILNQAAGTGARQASQGTQTNAQVQQTVLNYLHSANIPTTHAIVTVRDRTQPSLDVSQASQLDNLEVTVSVPAADITWTGTYLVMSPTSLVNARCEWVSARGQVYPTGITVPLGF